MNERENTLRAVRFEKPERIPVNFHINKGCWEYYPHDALFKLMAEHPLLFPDFRYEKGMAAPKISPMFRAGKPYTDSWGCLWETTLNGLAGAVIKHALDDWSKFRTYQPPSPDDQNGDTAINWEAIRTQISSARQNGRLASGSLRHGHTFLTLTYIRGYENIIFDMHDGQPLLNDLIAMVEEFNLGLVRNFIEAGVEWMDYPEDLGMQKGPMISPAHFRKYIKPVYQRLVKPAKEAGCVIHMHSDGDIRELAPDLLDVGFDALNLQDLVNGIDWIESNLKGRVCIHLDIDRQNITRFGTPKQIDEHIGQAVKKLGSPDGGLMLVFGLYPGAPIENVKAAMESMDKYSQYYS